MKKILAVLSLIAFIMLCLCPDLVAQCPMCKMAAESDLRNGGTIGKGLNFGILYMLALPYILFSVIAFLWWKNRKKNGDDSSEIAEGHYFSEN